MPALAKPLQRDNPPADAILSALEIFPPDNARNIPVDAWPVAPNSQAMIAAIGGNKPLRYDPDIGFVLVPSTQKHTPSLPDTDPLWQSRVRQARKQFPGSQTYLLNS